ncbi:serine hydrolase [Acidaminobacter sp. JC074]|uniref:serine hydrolase domain-containing protein n=1 Tax=Acidaminobacter sp. JC074 TaxID=2530199 RepID=UPI001F0EFA71|nr:serine hydrolase [Acidaminobacter sp. JC074]MCH4889946.1 serine hydrolase [Acidaminobacter sp. JC074]
MKNNLEHLKGLIERDYKNMMGICILKGNNLVYEAYFNGFTRHDTLHIASVTKSITSILVGIAIDRGFIKSVEDYVLDYFPDYHLKRGEKTIKEVKIKHLLSMTAPYKYRSEPYTKVYSSNDWTKAALDLLGGRSEIGNFKYSTVGMQILSAILVKACGQSLWKFAKENLFDPLEIMVPSSLYLENKDQHLAFLKDKKASGWVVDPKGIHTGGWGLALKTSDLLKIGKMCLDGGYYNKKRVVSKEWLCKSTQIHSRFEDKAYGYLWWLLEGGYAAIGDGGNIIYVCPAKKIVVSITSSFKPRAKDRIEFIYKDILPYL